MGVYEFPSKPTKPMLNQFSRVYGILGELKNTFEHRLTPEEAKMITVLRRDMTKLQRMLEARASAKETK